MDKPKFTKGGLSFTRDINGDVIVSVEPGLEQQLIPGVEWQSIVASMSGHGDAYTFSIVQALHPCNDLPGTPIEHAG